MPARLLTLVRHAHADNARPGQEDAARPLSVRGQREAGLAASGFASAFPAAQFILASPSRRTRSTAEAFEMALGLGSGSTHYEDKLYLASVDALFEVVQSIDQRHAHVVVIGHNPGLSEFVRAFSGVHGMADLPPAAVKTFSCELRTWRELRAGSGQSVPNR